MWKTEKKRFQMSKFQYSLIVHLIIIAFSVALKCYEGSRGIVNGEDSTNFVENQCDDNMTYCFESYNTNLTEVTASCQSMGTDPKLLDVCKLEGKCRERSDIDVTVCCCTTNLCNLQDDLKPTPETPIDNSDVNSTTTTTMATIETQTETNIDRFEGINETLSFEVNDTMIL